MEQPPEGNPWAGAHETFAALHLEAKELYDAHMAAGAVKDIHRFIELERRVWQLGWVLHQIETISGQAAEVGFHDAILSLVKPEAARATTELAFQGVWALEAQCDGFYAIAHRIVDLLRKCKPLNIEPRGVILVRNLLIFHPEQKNGVISYSFGMGGGQVGPIYKPAKSAGDEGDYQDPGLIPNALEFAAALSERIRSYPRPRPDGPSTANTTVREPRPQPHRRALSDGGRFGPHGKQRASADTDRGGSAQS